MLNQFSKILFFTRLAAVVCCVLACTKNQALFESTEFEFQGAERIVDNNDGTFTLSWEPVPAGEVTYYIYSRLKSDSYNFSVETAKTNISTWTSANLRFSGNTCFVVRFRKSELDFNDTNKNEKCTEKPAYVFAGIDSHEITSTGNVKLKWTEIPQEGVMYQVFETSTAGKYDFTNPKTAISGKTYEISGISLETKKCFVVRYSIPGIIDDANINEVCPALPYISGFNGVDSATSTDTGMATVTWTKPTTGSADVAGYRVYSGTDFKTQVGSTVGTNSSVSVGNLTPDATVTLGVRAFDKYGREDTNTRTVSVTVVNNALPNFGGVDLLTQKSANTIEVKWVASDIKPSKYNVYKASGPRNTTFSVETSTPFVSVSADTYTRDVTPLGDDQSHCFAVKAETSGGQKDTNTVVKCLTLADNGAPVFSGVKNVVMTSGKATVTWDEAVGETTTYRVFYQVGGTLNFGTASSVDVASPLKTVEIAGLTDSTNYSFGVRAIDRFGVSDTNSTTLVRNTGDVTPPVFNGIVSATVLDENNIQMIFNKSTESDVSYYSLRTRQNGASNWLENKRVYQNQISGATHTITLDGLTLGTTYDLIIKVVDTSTNESTNASVTTRTTADLTPPTFAGVESATGVSGTPTSATISWNAATDNSGIKEYRVFYATASMSSLSFANANFTGSTATISGVTITRSAAITSGTSLVVSGLNANTTYYFRVHAIDNQNNENANARQNSYSVPDTTPPATPVASYSPSGPTGATSQRTFTVVGTAAQGNEVRVYANGSVVGSTTLSATTSYSITATLPNTSGTYVITVKQVNTYGLESAAATLGSYVLDVSGPTITIVSSPSPTKIGDATSLAPSSSFTFKADEGGSYTVSESTTSLGSGSLTANVDRTITLSASQLTAGDGTKTITISALDAAGNTSTTTVSIIVDTTAPSIPTNFMAVRDEQTGKYHFSWTAVGLESTDILRIRRATATLTPPVNLSSGSQIGSDIPSSDSTSSADYGTETQVAFRIFTCDAVGNCSVAACASCQAAIDGTFSYQNLSEADFLSAKWTDGAATTTTKLGYARSRAAIEGWDGDAGGIATGSVIVEGDAYCASANTCSVTFASDAPWQRRMWRVSAVNSVSGGKGVWLSKIRHWAKVPSGMVFVAKEDWPHAQYGQVRHKAFDYAIDKYEVYETTTATNPGGNAGSAAYPNTYNSVLKSASGFAPKGGLDWFRFKQGCYNRTLEPEMTNYIVGTATSLHPKRQIHLATSLERFVASIGTPAVGGAGNCNVDNKNSNSPTTTGASGTANCISYFGANDMVGNMDEYTDSYYANFTHNAQNSRISYYGTSFQLTETMPISYSTTLGYVAGWDFNLAYPSRIVASEVSTFGNDNAYFESGSQAHMWGGNYLSNSTDVYYGIYRASLYQGPAYNAANVGGRCALTAPSPEIKRFQNDSVGTKAQFYWEVANSSSEGTLVVKLAFGSDKNQIDGWTGEDSTITNGGVITFSTSGGVQSFSSSTFAGLNACGTYTPLSSGTTGSCSLDLAAAPFSLSPWTKRFFKLYTYNATVGSYVAGGAMSSTSGVAVAPPGMVFVAKEDWPIENVGTTLGWDYKSGAAFGAQYDGVTGPFDFAIDKYEVYETTSAQNPGGTSGSAAYPNTYNSVLRSASAQTAKNNIDWYRLKQGCENRTSESDYLSYVGNTTLARTATTHNPRMRVHLSTDAEWFISAFQTDDTESLNYCRTGAGSAVSTGSTSTANCISRYGTIDMVGNLWENSDGFWTGVSGTTGNRTTFYGTGFPISISSISVPNSLGQYVTSFSFINLLPTGVGDGLKIFGFDAFWTGTWGNNMVIGYGGEWDQTKYSGRFASASGDANGSGANSGGRCSLVRP